jgi:acylglycerol lipase
MVMLGKGLDNALKMLLKNYKVELRCHAWEFLLKVPTLPLFLLEPTALSFFFSSHPISQKQASATANPFQMHAATVKLAIRPAALPIKSSRAYRLVRYLNYKLIPFAASSMVRFSKGKLTSSTGHDLVTVDYLPDSAPRAVLCFHHGVQEHIGRYSQIFTSMANSGIAVYSFDAIGHGLSGGERAFIPKFSILVDDFEAVCAAAAAASNKITSASTPIPLFIGGHSLGGLVAILTCLKDQSKWKGLILSSPAIDVEWTPILKVQAALGNILAAVVPKARIVPAVEPKFMNRDPEKVKEYVEDPLNTVGSLAARTANESLRAFSQLSQQTLEITLPVYAHHGTDDKVTSFSATK